MEIQIELGTVMKVLDKFRCDKAGGTDDLSSRLLIELKEVICYPVMKIISESLLTGIVLDDWKTANVTLTGRGLAAAFPRTPPPL